MERAGSSASRHRLWDAPEDTASCWALPASSGCLVSVSHLLSCRSVFLGLWSLRDRLWFRIGISQPLPIESFHHSIQEMRENHSFVCLFMFSFAVQPVRFNMRNPSQALQARHGPGSASTPTTSLC